MNKEPITLHLETFNNEEYILADECIKAIGIHRKTNTKLHKEIKRLKEEYMILQNASDEVEEEKDKEIERLNKLKERYQLEKEVFKDRIDKAIEYIETHQLNFKHNTTTFGSERLSMEERKLLDILRGEDKE